MRRKTIFLALVSVMLFGAAALAQGQFHRYGQAGGASRARGAALGWGCRNSYWRGL